MYAFGDGFTGQLGLGDRGSEAESRSLRPRVVRIERNAGGGGGSPGDVNVTEVSQSKASTNYFVSRVEKKGPFVGPLLLDASACARAALSIRIERWLGPQSGSVFAQCFFLSLVLNNPKGGVR